MYKEMQVKMASQKTKTKKTKGEKLRKKGNEQEDAEEGRREIIYVRYTIKHSKKMEWNAKKMIFFFYFFGLIFIINFLNPWEKAYTSVIPFDF